jgi:hypothetical protein
MTFEEQLQQQTIMKAVAAGHLPLAGKLFRQLKKAIRSQKRSKAR